MQQEVFSFKHLPSSNTFAGAIFVFHTAPFVSIFFSAGRHYKSFSDLFPKLISLPLYAGSLQIVWMSMHSCFDRNSMQLQRVPIARETSVWLLLMQSCNDTADSPFRFHNFPSLHKKLSCITPCNMLGRRNTTRAWSLETTTETDASLVFCMTPKLFSSIIITSYSNAESRTFLGLWLFLLPLFLSTAPACSVNVASLQIVGTSDV